MHECMLPCAFTLTPGRSSKIFTISGSLAETASINAEFSWYPGTNAKRTQNR